MIASNHNVSCQQAEPFYYDLLPGNVSPDVPHEVSDHVKHCRHCKAQMHQLKHQLQSIDKPDAGPASTTDLLAVCLGLHFAHVGQPVSCAVVKPFLPSLAMPDLKIKIPTPITVHIDNCPACAQDLQTIGQLNLADKQLRRLTELLTADPPKDRTSCAEARKFILPLAEADYSPAVSAEVLRHVCICPECRARLYQARQALAPRWQTADSTERLPFPCDQVNTSDIFDYVVPYGIDPANDQYARFRPSLTTHLRQCPDCLEKMQKLHEELYAIVGRRESGVVTKFTVARADQREAQVAKPEDVYAYWPVNVEVLAQGDESATAQTPVTETPDQQHSAPVLSPQWPSESVVESEATNSEEGQPDHAAAVVGPTVENRVRAASATPRASRRRVLTRWLATAAAIMIAALGISIFTNNSAVAATFDQVVEALRRITSFSYTRVEKDGSVTQYWRSFAPKAYLRKKYNGTVLHSFGEPEQTWRYDPESNTITISHPTDRQSYLRAGNNIIEYMEENIWRHHIDPSEKIESDYGTLDGNVVDVFTFHKPSGDVVKMWCDRNTHLPLRTQLTTQTITVGYRLEYADEIPSSVYELGVPENATIIETY